MNWRHTWEKPVKMVQNGSKTSRTLLAHSLVLVWANSHKDVIWSFNEGVNTEVMSDMHFLEFKMFLTPAFLTRATFNKVAESCCLLSLFSLPKFFLKMTKNVNINNNVKYLLKSQSLIDPDLHVIIYCFIHSVTTLLGTPVHLLIHTIISQSYGSSSMHIIVQKQVKRFS